MISNLFRKVKMTLHLLRTNVLHSQPFKSLENKMYSSPAQNSYCWTTRNCNENHENINATIGVYCGSDISLYRKTPATIAPELTRTKNEPSRCKAAAANVKAARKSQNVPCLICCRCWSRFNKFMPQAGLHLNTLCYSPSSPLSQHLLNLEKHGERVYDTIYEVGTGII